MELIGSQTSPYVRRLRIAFPDLSFRHIDIFSNEGRDELRNLSPVLKIPVLKIEDKVIYDSRQIFYYLSEFRESEGRQSESRLSSENENWLSMIDALNDQLISGLMLERSGVTVPPDSILEKSWRERLSLTLDFFENRVDELSWSYPSICLFCLLDWADFRDRFDLDEYPELNNWRKKQLDREEVKVSDPRRLPL